MWHPLRVLIVCAALAVAACSSNEPAAARESASPPPSDAQTRAAAAAPASTRPRIVFLGDSLTAGYGLDVEQSVPSLVQRHLDAEGYQYEVVNAGVAGDTSAGGLRRPRTQESAQVTFDSQGNGRSADNLFMNGPEVFNFTLDAVPASVRKLLEKAGVAQESVDLFVFHQANRYMLDHLRKKLQIPEEKFCFAMSDCGNTVSSTIPIALKSAAATLRDGALVMLVGFGVGYSWGATLWRCTGSRSQGWYL